MDMLSAWVDRRTMISGLRTVVLAAALASLLGSPVTDAWAACQDVPTVFSSPAGASAQIFLPVVGAGASACAPIRGAEYHTLPVINPSTHPPAELHPDLNLDVRGYIATAAYLGLVEIDGPADAGAPQLATLFADQQPLRFAAAYQVYDWDWTADMRGLPIQDPPVTLASLAAPLGKIVHLPNSGYSIGGGYEALVLYASEESITLKYTRDDNVARGYTIHIKGICVESTLLALYRTSDHAGRVELPALSAGQPLGRVRGTGIRVAIRDSGRFLDPRSRKDWWRDQTALR